MERCFDTDTAQKIFDLAVIESNSPIGTIPDADSLLKIFACNLIARASQHTSQGIEELSAQEAALFKSMRSINMKDEFSRLRGQLILDEYGAQLEETYYASAGSYVAEQYEIAAAQGEYTHEGYIGENRRNALRHALSETSSRVMRRVFRDRFARDVDRTLPFTSDLQEQEAPKQAHANTVSAGRKWMEIVKTVLLQDRNTTKEERRNLGRLKHSASTMSLPDTKRLGRLVRDEATSYLAQAGD